MMQCNQWLAPAGQAGSAVAVAIAMAWPHGAWAQLDRRDVNLPDVHVTDTRPEALPSPEAQWNGAALMSRRVAVSDTARLLQELPGVAVYGAGGVSSLPVVHGLADDRLRVRVDGMDLISACANHMNPPLSYIDPTQVAQVRVLAGVTPVSAGGDSLGAVVDVASAPLVFAAQPGETLHSGELGLVWRSNGQAYRAHWGAQWASDRWSLSYQGATAGADNYRAAQAFKPTGPAAAGRAVLRGDEVGSTAYRSTNHLLTLGGREAQQEWSVQLGVQDIPMQGWANQRMDMTRNDSERLNFRYQGTFDWGRLQARLYHEHTRHAMDFGPDKLYWYGATMALDGVAAPVSGGMAGTAAGMPMDTEGSNTGAKLQADWVLGAADVWRLGGEWQRYRLDDWWQPSGKGMWPNTFWNIRDGQRDRWAVFAEWEKTWNPHWLSLLGLRHESVRSQAGAVQGYNPTFDPASEAAFNARDRQRTDRHLDVVALARYTATPTATYEWGYALKTRAPNLYERYAWSTHGMAMRMVNLVGDGNGYVGNLQLQPETAHTLSLAADWHDSERQRWQVQVKPYITHVDGFIDAQRCATGGNACTPVNLGLLNGFVYLRYLNQSARLQGVDVSGQIRWQNVPHTGQWLARAQLSQVRGTNRDTGAPLYNIMPLQARLGLEHRRDRWTHTLEAELVAAKHRVNPERNEWPTPGYALVHWRASVDMDWARVDMGVENLFNRFYQHPLAGAYVGQGKTMSGTAVPWGVPVPGAGRSFYLGVNKRF